MDISIKNNFRVGILKKQIDGFISYQGKHFSFSYSASGLFSKSRKLQIDGRGVVSSVGREGCFNSTQSDYSFNIQNTIIEGLTLMVLTEKLKISSRGVLLSRPDAYGYSNILLRTAGSTKGKVVYKCRMKKNNLFVFYSKIKKKYKNCAVNDCALPWEIALFFIMSTASTSSGYNKD
jgi:hypothetical protein